MFTSSVVVVFVGMYIISSGFASVFVKRPYKTMLAGRKKMRRGHTNIYAGVYKVFVDKAFLKGKVVEEDI